MYALLYHSDEYRISYITVLNLYLITERFLETSCFRASSINVTVVRLNECDNHVNVFMIMMSDSDDDVIF